PAVWTITQPAMDDAPGVGFTFKDGDGRYLDSVDPYEYPDEVAQSCYEATLPVPGDDEAGTAPAAPAQGALPATGADSNSLIGLGVAGLLTAVGVGLVALRRGRIALDS